MLLLTMLPRGGGGGGGGLSCCSTAVAESQAVAGSNRTHPHNSRMMAAQDGSRLTTWQQLGGLGAPPSLAHTGSPGWSVTPGGLQ